MSRRFARRDGGFALIESIAVLGLASLVMVTLVIAADLVTRSTGAAARRASQIEVFATGLSALRQDLAGAKLVRIGGDGENRLLFSGQSTSLGLVVGSDRSDRYDGETLIWIETETTGDRSNLVRTSARLTPRTEGFADAEFGNPAVLLTGPWSYRFSYASQEGSELRWSSSWSTSKAMPAAVRLEVTDKGGLDPILPPLVVRLHVNAETKCPGGEDPPCAEEEPTPEEPQNQPGQGEDTG